MNRISYLIILILTFTACSHKSDPDEPPVGTLVENAEMPVLRKSVETLLNHITDSGTLYSLYLNEPDSLKTLFSDKQWIKNWVELILAEKNIGYPLHFATKAHQHGLDKSYYHAAYLELSTARIKSHSWDTAGKIPYDSLAMHLFYAADAIIGIYHDMSCGRANPDYSGSIDALPRRPYSGSLSVMQSDSIIAKVTAAFPVFHPYTQLQAEYERLSGFTPEMLGPQLVYYAKIKPGDTMGKKAVALAKKLRLHGVLLSHDSIIAKKRLYDAELATAVSTFRLKQGLEPGTVIDKETVTLLNTTHQDMLHKLRANLERWRWLGPVNEKSRIWVNIAENKAYAWQEDTLELVMNVCTGKNRDDNYYERLEKSKTDKDAVPPDNLETPLMKAKLKYIVANPTWHVPRNIMTKELLPAIQKDPAYLANHNYRLFNWKGEEINPFSVNWSKVTRDNWKFRVEQGEGEDNALGIVVLQFPNKYSIFMHDTPSKYAFKLDNRHVSHGCVRMEKPVEMVEFLSSFNNPDNYDEMLIALGKEPVRDEKKIEKYKEAMKDSVKAAKLKPRANTYYKVSADIPVYLVYFTASLNDLGGWVYTKDGYDRDNKLLQAMQKPEKRAKPVELSLQTPPAAIYSP